MDLVVIVGPTAAGKSALAQRLACSLGAEIVSADAVQVYRHLDIGSAKPSTADRASVRHHLVDILEPTETVDAATWAQAADEAIRDIRARGQRPIVCGGTGLYVRALLHGLTEIPDIDPAIRQAVRGEVADRGADVMHGLLAELDEPSAARIAPRDGQRIGRALEVFRQTGKPLSAWQADHAFAPRRHPARVVGLWPERDVLLSRIDARVDRMLADGWIDEVRTLLAGGLSPDAPGLCTLGYREVVAYLQSPSPRGELAEAIRVGHRRYAKRQLTWFRGVTGKDDDLIHFDPTAPDILERLTARIG